jgi:hypothetical protein
MFWYDNIDASRACYLEEALPGSFVVKRVGKAKQQKSHFEDHYPGYTPSKPSMRKRNLRGSNGVAAVTVPITAVAWRQTISKFNASINHSTEDRHIDGFELVEEQLVPDANVSDEEYDFVDVSASTDAVGEEMDYELVAFETIGTILR